MKTILSTAAALLAFTGTVALADGNPADGEKDFKKCKACHSIVSPDGENIVKGGRTGPNLYGVVGRQAGTFPDFKYGDSIIAAGAAGLVWTPELMVEYAKDPKEFLRDYLDDTAAKSMMTFKLKDAEDVVAYLSTFSTEMVTEDDGHDDDDSEESND